MKTKEELNALKNEVEELNKKLAELTEDELKSVTGGASILPPGPTGPSNPLPRRAGDGDCDQSRPVTCPFCKHEFLANHHTYNCFCPNCCQTFVGAPVIE